MSSSKPLYHMPHILFNVCIMWCFTFALVRKVECVKVLFVDTYSYTHTHARSHTEKNILGILLAEITIEWRALFHTFIFSVSPIIGETPVNTDNKTDLCWFASEMRKVTIEIDKRIDLSLRNVKHCKKTFCNHLFLLTFLGCAATEEVTQDDNRTW